MLSKQKFKPNISRVKLNPEQAVLVCACYNQGFGDISTSSYVSRTMQLSACGHNSKGKSYRCEDLRDPRVNAMPAWRNGVTIS